MEKRGKPILSQIIAAIKEMKNYQEVLQEISEGKARVQCAACEEIVLAQSIFPLRATLKCVCGATIFVCGKHSKNDYWYTCILKEAVQDEKL